MGKFSVRKGNLGRAIIRFLIGLLLLAIIVWALYAFVLKGDFDMTQTANGVNATPAPLTLATPSTNPQDLIAEPTVTSPADTVYLPGMEDELPEATATPTPEPTPEPTPTPAPTATPIPADMFSKRTDKQDLEKLNKWGLKNVDNGLTRFEIPKTNGGKVISLVGWGIAKDKNFDAQNCELFIMVLDKKNNVRLYEATKAAGVTGMTHTGLGKNLEMSDFTAMIDVSDFADGDYQIGVAIQYHYNKNKSTNRLAFTFGDAYNFTVLGGVITAVNGIEQ